MTLSTAALVQKYYRATTALGKKVVNSDFSMQIDGFEDNWLLCKQAPWPMLSPAGEIEIPGTLGTAYFQPQQIKFNQQGQVSFHETVAGSIDQMLVDLLAKTGNDSTLFDAWVYEGTPQAYLRKKRITDCFFQIDNPDRDWENRSQILVFSGTMFFHYFSAIDAGNSSDYR